MLRVAAVLVAMIAATPPVKSVDNRIDADPALQRTISLKRAHIYLGELAGELSRSAKKPLRIDLAKGPVDGIQLVAVCRDRPVVEVMKAVVGVLNTRFDRWEWQAVDKPTEGYVLRHQHSPAESAALARQEMIRKWSEDVRAYYAIARTPREGRTAKALSRLDLFPDRKVDHALMDIVATIEPQQLDVVFRGGEVTIDGSRLSGEAAQKLEAGHPAVPGGKTFAAAFWTSWNQLNAGPVLWVRSSSGVSQSIMGGVIWDSNWFQAAGEGWHYTGAAETQAFLISRARREPNLGEPGPVLTLPAWMRNAAEKQDLNLIADSVYPRGNSRGGSSWIGRTPEQTMAALSLDGEMTWKKAGAFYLLRDKSAEAHPRPHLVTWSDIRSLREDSEANGGYLSFNSLLRLSEKSGPQLDGLSEEFPTAEGDVIADWLPVFHFYANLDPSAQRKLLSKEGLPLGEAGLLARNTLAEPGDRTGVRGLALLDKDPRHAVLALIRATDDVGERGHTLTWRVTIPDVPSHDLKLKLVPRRPLIPE